MYTEKYLLADFTTGAYPTLVASGIEGSPNPSGPASRGEGLVSDGTYLYHVDRNEDENAVRRINITTLASELGVIPSDGSAASSTDPFDPDNFHQGSFNNRGTHATYVSMPFVPPAPAGPSTFGNIVW